MPFPLRGALVSDHIYTPTNLWEKYTSLLSRMTVECRIQDLLGGGLDGYLMAGRVQDQYGSRTGITPYTTYVSVYAENRSSHLTFKFIRHCKSEAMRDDRQYGFLQEMQTHPGSMAMASN